MALFIKNATDQYDKDATFDYNQPLSRTVGQASVHTHSNDIQWLTDTSITCKSPKVTETYQTIEKISGLDFYMYLLKMSAAPFSLGMHGYSINMSGLYLNTSFMTINLGRRFLLPSPNRHNVGLWQVKVETINREDNARSHSREKQKKSMCVVYAEYIKGKKTQT